MESSAYIKNIAMSPKKIRFILDDVKRLKPIEALHKLKYTNNKSSKLLYTAIHSALTNAKNTLNTTDDLIEFKALIVEQGRKVKRFRPGGRGMAKPYAHKYSHIKIVLRSSGSPIKKSKVAAASKSEVAAKTEAVKIDEKTKTAARARTAAPRVIKARAPRPVAQPKAVTRQKKG